MKDVIAALLASSLVMLSLIQLLSAGNAPDSTSSASVGRDQEKISDLGLRFVFK
jgi:hypothetical protein